MVVIAIIRWGYKPTYKPGAPHCRPMRHRWLGHQLLAIPFDHPKITRRSVWPKLQLPRSIDCVLFSTRGTLGTLSFITPRLMVHPERAVEPLIPKHNWVNSGWSSQNSTMKHEKCPGQYQTEMFEANIHSWLPGKSDLWMLALTNISDWNFDQNMATECLLF